jgi:hypothetical protein
MCAHLRAFYRKAKQKEACHETFVQTDYELHWSEAPYWLHVGRFNNPPAAELIFGRFSRTREILHAQAIGFTPFHAFSLK